MSEIDRERKYVYVDEAGYELLVNAPNSIALDLNKNCKYLNREQHKQRLVQAKSREIERLAEIKT